MKRDRTFSLQTLIISVLFVALSIEFGVTAQITYQNLKTTILAGFDKKLDAISTTGGLFIDGDAHQKIFEPKQIQAIALDSKRDRIVGMQNSRNQLVTIDATTGGALDLATLSWEPLVPVPIISLTYNSVDDLFYALAENGKSTFTISPESGRVLPAIQLPTPATAIAYRADTNSLYMFGEQVAQVDFKKRSVEPLFAAPSKITGATWDAKQNRFLLIQGDTGTVFTASLTEAQAVELGTITTVDAKAPDADAAVADTEEAVAEAPTTEETDEDAEAAPDQWKEPEVVVLPASGIGIDPTTNQLYTATDRLIRVSSETGHGDPAGFRMGFRNELDPLYQDYAARMKRVMDAAGLTYHYTVILPKENQLIYIIDATGGEDHSALGTEEEVEPEEWARLNAVNSTGISTESKVKHFDLWGLLKVGSAAIRNSSEQIVGLVGADVNISIIDKKTRIALIRVLALAILGLLFAGAAAVWIARDLGAPMSRLKEGILRVAAGQYDERIQLQGPRELNDLARAFDATREQLRSTVTVLEQENSEFERGRRRHILEKMFLDGVSGIPQTNLQGSKSYILATRVGATPGKHDVSGCIRKAERGVLWIGESSASSLLAAKRRSDLTLICERLMERYADQWDEFPKELSGMLADDVTLFLVFDLGAGKVVAVSESAVSAPLVLVNREQGVESVSVGTRDNIDLKPGESMFLSTIQEAERTTKYVDDLTTLWSEQQLDQLLHATDGGEPELKVVIHRSSDPQTSLEGDGYGTL